MKKQAVALALAVLLLSVGCGHKESTPTVPEVAQEAQMQQAETDFYTMTVAKDWQWEVVRYGEDLPSGDLLFYDGQQKKLGGGAIVVAANDALSDLPEQIQVIRQEVTENGWIVGKIEVVGDAAGGATSSQCHVLIPLNDDRQLHEYIDIYLDGQRFDLQQTLALAETVVIRQSQLFGFVQSMGEDSLEFVRGQWVSAQDEAQIEKLGIKEEMLTRGFTIVPVEEAVTLKLSPEVRYYLVDAADQLFKEVTRAAFLENLQTHPEEVYDLTLLDGEVISVEERAL